MDPKKVQENEELLNTILDGDHKMSGLVGLTALTLLTEMMPPEVYKPFVYECIRQAETVMEHRHLEVAKQPDKHGAPKAPDKDNHVLSFRGRPISKSKGGKWIPIQS
jgi:hypothetical protein